MSRPLQGEARSEETAPELRQDPFTRDWVVISPGRALRPHQVPEPIAESARLPAIDPDYPFCPGNEDRTPQELWRLHGADENWAIRVVPNRYPILATGSGPVRRRANGPFVTADGLGAHEIVIETPRHDLDLPDLDDAAVTAVFEAYRARSRVLRATRPGLVLPFRNHGAASGTSLRHPHSQIVELPVVPLRFRQRFDIARAYYDDHGSSLNTDVTAAELDEGTRVIAVSDHIVALAPFASTAPYEMRVVPRDHQASFADVSDETLAETGRMLRRLLVALRGLLGDIPYNYVIISAPSEEKHAASFSWHLDVLPRLVVAAGFEMGTGTAVNPVPPEHAAAQLRRVMPGLPDSGRLHGGLIDGLQSLVIGLPGSDHHDRAARMLDAALRNRPHQRAGEPSMASVAHDQDVRRPGCFDENVGGVAFNDLVRHLDRCSPGRRLADRLGQPNRRPLGRNIVGIDPRIPALTAVRFPGADSMDCRTGQLGLVQRPSQGLDRRRRAVDTHHDASVAHSS